MTPETVVEQALWALHEHDIDRHLTYIAHTIVHEGAPFDPIVGKEAYVKQIEQIKLLPIHTCPKSFDIINTQEVDQSTVQIRVRLYTEDTVTRSDGTNFTVNETTEVIFTIIDGLIRHMSARYIPHVYRVKLS